MTPTNKTINSISTGEMFANYPDVLTVTELSRALRIGKNTAYSLVNSGEIKNVRIGKKILIPKLYLIEYFNDADLVEPDNEDDLAS